MDYLGTTNSSSILENIQISAKAFVICDNKEGYHKIITNGPFIFNIQFDKYDVLQNF
jgi:hypothetical protein